jgi:glycosyltransferase involved in cell wall biosynthesis
MRQGITVHTIVKNEEKWVWYALMSVKAFVDKILVFDTGSDDRTVEIIKSIKDKKIIFEEKGEVDSGGLVRLRQEQLERTKTDWFLLVDGDEVWPKKTIMELVETIEMAPKEKLGVVIRAWNLIGDVYHYHPESDYYHWPFAPKDYLGWANLRALRRNISGIKITGKYPLEAYCDKTDTPIQNYGEEKLIFLEDRYLHTTYLPRSNFFNDLKTLNRKLKFEIGKKFPNNYFYPEVFYQKRPRIVFSPWRNRNIFYWVFAGAQTPLRKIKRKILKIS